MADRTVLGKVSLSFAPAQKVAPLKRERRNPGERRFERELKEEEENASEDRVDIGAGSREKDEKEHQKREGSAAGATYHTGADKKNRRNDDSAEPGSILDIRV